MVTIVDCSEFDKTLGQTDLNEFKLVDSPGQHNTSEVLFGCCLSFYRGHEQFVRDCAWELTHARALLLQLFPTRLTIMCLVLVSNFCF